MKADPIRSAGARQERKAIRAYLRRALQRAGLCEASLKEVLDWVLKRQQRYDTRPGGLGKR